MGIILVVFGVILSFLLYRNSWVYNQRIKIIDMGECSCELDNYISYNKMLLKIFTWDINKMKK